jgi:hypothetical protein
MPYGLDALYEASQVETRWDELVTPPEPEFDYDDIDYSEDIQGDY